jgi:hypothetical protein
MRSIEGKETYKLELFMTRGAETATNVPYRVSI